MLHNRRLVRISSGRFLESRGFVGVQSLQQVTAASRVINSRRSVPETGPLIETYPRTALDRWATHLVPLLRVVSCRMLELRRLDRDCGHVGRGYVLRQSVQL